MKKIHFVLLFIIVVLVSCATSLAYTRLIQNQAPDNAPLVEHVWTQADSATCADIVSNILWPTFETPADVEAYYQEEMNYRMKDSIFFSIPLEKLRAVAQVTSGKFNGNPITIEDLVLEYLRHHQDIYQYIEPAQESTSPAQPLQPDSASSAKTDSI